MSRDAERMYLAAEMPDKGTAASPWLVGSPDRQANEALAKAMAGDPTGERDG